MLEATLAKAFTQVTGFMVSASRVVLLAKTEKSCMDIPELREQFV